MIPIVAVVWLILAVGNGLFFSFPIFFVPLLEEFHWSRALTAGALSLSTVVQGVLAPVAGILADRFGTRPVILGGVVLLSAGSVLAGAIRAPWHLYLCTGVVGALGLVGLGSVPMGTLLSRRVSECRGRMMGIAFSGMGIGVFTIGPVTQWLINLFGWRTASVMLGAAAFAILFPLAWLGVRDAPTPRRGGNGAGRPKPVERAAGVSDGPPRSRRDHGTGPPDATLGDALRTRAFWALALAYFMTPLAVFSVLIHQVAFAVDLGFPRMLVASVFGAMGLMSTVGRVGFGIIADRAGGPVSATISFACTAGGSLALLALDLRPHPAWLVVYALLFGLGFGARGPIITAMATDLFGGRHFGVIYGALNVGNGIAGAAGPWFGGLVHDVTGSYRVVFVFSVVASAIGAACFWAARPHRVRP